MYFQLVETLTKPSAFKTQGQPDGGVKTAPPPYLAVDVHNEGIARSIHDAVALDFGHLRLLADFVSRLEVHLP